MKKVGLTIRGGGMRAVAYIGALKALQEYEIPIDYIVGASGGAIVGESIALGKSLEELLNHFRTFKPVTLYGPNKIIRGKIFNYKKWLQHAKNLIPAANLEEASIKTLVQVTNFDTHELEYLDSGDAAQIAIASSAFIGPYEYNGKKYLDGEYLPFFGADKLRELGADIVIALLVENDPGERSGFLENILEPMKITQDKIRELDLKKNPVDHLIKIQLTKTSLFGTKKIDKSFELGYEVTKNYIEENNLLEMINE